MHAIIFQNIEEWCTKKYCIAKNKCCFSLKKHFEASTCLKVAVSELTGAAFIWIISLEAKFLSMFRYIYVITKSR